MKGRQEVVRQLRTMASKARSSNIKDGLRRGAEIMRRSAEAEAPIGDPKRSSLYAAGKSGRPLVHPGRLKEAHIVEDTADGVSVTIDPDNPAAEYGPLVHQGKQGRGTNAWMDRAYDKHHTKVEKVIIQDLTRELDHIIE